MAKSILSLSAAVLQWRRLLPISAAATRKQWLCLRNTIATVLAQRMGASYRQLYVPDSVSEEILNSILAEDTGVKAVVDIIKQADILVHGVGQAAVMARHRRMALFKNFWTTALLARPLASTARWTAGRFT